MRALKNGKRVGVIQSCYIPWRGYFDFINSVDLFIVYDDVQFSTGSWRNRNKVKTPRGLQWMTVPVRLKLGLAIDEVRIGHTKIPWRDAHRRLLHEALGPAPFFSDAIRIWEDGVSGDFGSISELNVRLMRLVCDYLRISTSIMFSRDFKLKGTKTERLIELLQKAGASVYLSGPTAKNYLNESRFRQLGIGLEYKIYDYDPYPQLWGSFEGAVTVLDLIANVGTDARRFLNSRSPNQIAVV